MEPPQSATGGDDGLTRWRELSAQCELLQAAAIAWGNVLEAYKAALVGKISADALAPEVALAQYKSARALQLVAEQALLAYVQGAQPSNGA